MQAENADSAGLNLFPFWPATFARSAAHATHARTYVRLYNIIVTARPSSPQEGARSRSPQLEVLDQKCQTVQALCMYSNPHGRRICLVVMVKITVD